VLTICGQLLRVTRVAALREGHLQWEHCCALFVAFLGLDIPASIFSAAWTCAVRCGTIEPPQPQARRMELRDLYLGQLGLEPRRSSMDSREDIRGLPSAAASCSLVLRRTRRIKKLGQNNSDLDPPQWPTVGGRISAQQVQRRGRPCACGSALGSLHWRPTPDIKDDPRA